MKTITVRYFAMFRENQDISVSRQCADPLVKGAYY